MSSSERDVVAGEVAGDGTQVAKSMPESFEITISPLPVDASRTEFNSLLRSGRIAFITVLAFALVLSRAGHTLLAQPFKKSLIGGEKELHVPKYHTLLEASSWPLSMLFWFATAFYKGKKIRVDNWRYRLKMYGAMAFVDAINSILGSMGLNYLPSGIYTILKSTSMIFAVVFARTMTRKEFNKFHYIGASILVVGTAVITTSTKSMSWDENGGFNMTAFYGMCGCISSAMCIAFLGVLTYKFFVHEKVKGDILVVAENNAFQAFFMWIFLLPLLGSQEAASWSSTLQQIKDHGSSSLFVSLSVGMLICRPITEFSGIAVTAFTSNVLTRALGGPRRLLVILGGYFIFHEPMAPATIVAVVCMLTALSVYVYGGYRLKVDKIMRSKVSSGSKSGVITEQ